MILMNTKTLVLLSFCLLMLSFTNENKRILEINQKINIANNELIALTQKIQNEQKNLDKAEQKRLLQQNTIDSLINSLNPIKQKYEAHYKIAPQDIEISELLDKKQC